MSFNVPSLILKKRTSNELNHQELKFLIDGFSDASIPDYQISAWLMASFLRGMNQSECHSLTQLMKDSGKSFDWKKISSELSDSAICDKHSTGGVGDKTSFIVAPLAVSMGMKVPMMSGRGLGHTGGTLDKLESIAGLNLLLSPKEMLNCLIETGCFIISQSKDLCPADAKLYGLRDVTATVDSVPLIAASILSKKWAAGVKNLVLDVKSGLGSVFENIEDARTLAKSLLEIAAMADIKTSALITDMNEPLGVMTGNALEIKECLWILKNEYPCEESKTISQPLLKLCCQLCAEMAVASGMHNDFDKAEKEALRKIESGEVFKIFHRMLLAQGAHPAWEEKLPSSKEVIPFCANKDGFISKIHAKQIGYAGIELGVGRKNTDSKLDLSSGFEWKKKVGSPLKKGDVIFLCHTNSKSRFESMKSKFFSSIDISDDPSVIASDLLIERISNESSC